MSKTWKTHKGIAVLAWTCLGWMAACQQGPDHDAPEEAAHAVQQTRLEESTICHDGAGDPPLAMRWDIPPTSIESTTMLSLLIESREDTTVDLSLLSQGLDARTVERPYGQLVLSAGVEEQVDVTIADLPLQSVTYSSLATVRATFTRPDGSLMVQNAPPFHHHFSSDYSRSFAYDRDTMESALNHGQLTNDAFNLVGRVWRGGTFVDLDDIHWEVYGGDPPDFAGPLIDYGSNPNIPETTVVGFPVCVDWETWYIDAAHGEDFVNTLGTQHIDASFAEYEIGKVLSTPCEALTPSASCVQIVKQGRLDADGCTTVPNALPGQSYFIWVYGKLVKGTVDAELKYYTNNGQGVGIPRLRLSFFVPPSGSPLPPFAHLKTFHHPANHAAAVMSRLLLSDLVVPDSDYIVHTNLDCPSIPDNACADTPDPAYFDGELWTGKWYHSTASVPGDLQYKYVAAHEAGHNVQYYASGIVRNTVDNNPYDDVFPNNWPLCLCNHVLTSNQYHCLQSLEKTEVAQAEAFAHFVAAKLFNDPTGGDCKFNYYKEFKWGSGGYDVVGPPYNADCRNAVKWRDNHCSYALATSGTEYDWLQFFWNVNTVGSDTSTMEDLYTIWKDGCGGGWCDDGDELRWEDVRAAAQAHFGSVFDPRYLNLFDDGDEFGVDADL